MLGLKNNKLILKIYNLGLTPKLLRPDFCSFWKFGQAVLIRVLMLNFETSCINTPLHHEHVNVISAKISFIEKKLQIIFGQK